MTLKELNEEYDKMQDLYGDKNINAILNGGNKNPDICLIFINPTQKNVACEKNWKGIRAPWIGTKNIWKLFYETNLIDKEIYNSIISKKSSDWDEEFAKKVYDKLSDNKCYVTNLGKCTQIDARPISDNILKEYIDKLYEEITILKPKKIILFGNQVSSIFLNEKISVSKVRKKLFKKIINNKEYHIYSVHYPVGNAIYNMPKTIEDINWILKQ